MKCFIKTTHLVLLLLIFLLPDSKILAQESKFKYSKNNIANYFSGILSLNHDQISDGFEYLNKAKELKTKHQNFNTQYIYSLILLNKFKEAFSFSRSVWKKDEFFFEADLLLGLEHFIKKDYLKAEKHFERLSNKSEYNLFFDAFFENFLLSWSKAAENNIIKSFELNEKIPERYMQLKRIQNSFLNCYFDNKKTESSFKKLIGNKESGYSRYIYFLTNYFQSKGNTNDIENLLTKNKDENNSSLLMAQTEDFFLRKKNKEILNFFSCKNPTDVIAEIFYLIANLYSTDENYQLSNFYLKISLFLNKKFTPNKTLLAENLYRQKKYKSSKTFYNLVKKIGPIYSWYASKNIALILLKTESKESSIASLEKEFQQLENPNYQHYFEMANIYKDNQYYEKSIKYYSFALKKIKNNDPLSAKILERRGTSYDSLGDWDKAEMDLKNSLKILPNQAYALNYLAYTWIDKKINIEKALQMLETATQLKENDGYIIDSLGWAHYRNKNYIDAAKFLQRAVELMPLDPVINDHYGDALWMLKKNIQARYFWQHAANLDNIKQELKKKINKKLIFGITKNL